mmetsp:Transcript_25871/g.97436  ORF Transcript_25871/g.97436 Transcript_25871/m.97436 type:complete len:340 (+) Transcript_25871:3796-4815(+)
MMLRPGAAGRTATWTPAPSCSSRPRQPTSRGESRRRGVARPAPASPGRCASPPSGATPGGRRTPAACRETAALPSRTSQRQRRGRRCSPARVTATTPCCRQARPLTSWGRCPLTTQRLQPHATAARKAGPPRAASTRCSAATAGRPRASRPRSCRARRLAPAARPWPPPPVPPGSAACSTPPCPKRTTTTTRTPPPRSAGSVPAARPACPRLPDSGRLPAPAWARAATAPPVPATLRGRPCWGRADPLAQAPPSLARASRPLAAVAPAMPPAAPATQSAAPRRWASETRAGVAARALPLPVAPPWRARRSLLRLPRGAPPRFATPRPSPSCPVCAPLRT